MKNMLATTWSNPRQTKAKVGHQMATILDDVSRAEKARKQARQTSQLQPIPRRKIWYHSGVTALAVVKVMTSALYAAELKAPPYPVRRPATKSEPARLPQKQMNQCMSILRGLSLR